MVITPTIAVYDLVVSDEVTDAALLKVWEDGITITTFYSFTATPISNSMIRYCIVYA